MKDDVSYLIKFGKKAHLKELVEGYLYCSSAGYFRDLEIASGKKGQGDSLEASLTIPVTRLKLVGETGAIEIYPDNCRLTYRNPEVAGIPIYCLTAVTTNDLAAIDGSSRRRPSPELEETIRAHFPSADGAVAISEPRTFIEDIHRSVKQSITAERVKYFNIAQGCGPNGSIPSGYIDFLTGGPNGQTEERKYFIDEDPSYKMLFCKDVFFEGEREFRIAFPEANRLQPQNHTKFFVRLSNRPRLMDLDEFFEQGFA